jgi:DNA-binding NarL/FixJ family response regulator
VKSTELSGGFDGRTAEAARQNRGTLRLKALRGAKAAVRVFVEAENRLLRESMTRVLAKCGDIEVTGVNSAEALSVDALTETQTEVLLLASRGRLDEDLALVHRVKGAAPGIRILMIGMTESEGTFLQCVQAGVTGYLTQNASAAEVLNAVRAVQAGESVCPGTLCAVLFRYFQSDTAAMPFASVNRRLGLSRREQQLVPLIAEGLTNKEIAGRFCLSEQTVKNHLYRMKHKLGAEGRLGIVHLYRAKGFFV